MNPTYAQTFTALPVALNLEGAVLSTLPVSPREVRPRASILTPLARRPAELSPTLLPDPQNPERTYDNSCLNWLGLGVKENKTNKVKTTNGSVVRKK